MNGLLGGIRWVSKPQTAKAVWKFERIYQMADFKMPRACERFFEHVDIEVAVERSWSTDQGGILFFSDHTTALDGFAISLACPEQFELKRVIFAMSGWLLGREFYRRNLLVYPHGSYRNLMLKTVGLGNKFLYFATHRWAPFGKKHAAVESICDTLENGKCVSLLPSGAIGVPQWRSGIGAVLLESGARMTPTSMPLFAAPVYLDWQYDPRRVTVSSPGLIRFETLLRQAGPIQNRDDMSSWLQRRYESRSWVYDVCERAINA